MGRRAGIIFGLAFGIPLLACALAALVILLVVGDQTESTRPIPSQVAVVPAHTTTVSSIATDEAARIALYERAAPAANAAPPSGAQFLIEGYRVLRKIGEGGMASIFLAQAAEGGPPQVLKVMQLASLITEAKVLLVHGSALSVMLLMASVKN